MQNSTQRIEWQRRELHWQLQQESIKERKAPDVDDKILVKLWKYLPV